MQLSPIRCNSLIGLNLFTYYLHLHFIKKLIVIKLIF